MENSLVTYGFNKDRERIEHLKWICDQIERGFCLYNSKYVVCFKKLFAGKGGLYEFIMFYDMCAG